MKIIDSHTHIVPEKIASVVQRVLEVDWGLPSFGQMTEEGLFGKMAEAGIDMSVIFCVAEKPSVVESANDFVINKCQHPKFIGLGTIHPDYQDFGAEIQRLKDAGLRGIKVHPVFQQCRPDEERMFRIYEALDDGMIICFHVGTIDNPTGGVSAHPETIARVIEAFPRLKVIAAHFGGLKMLKEAREHLLSKDVYIDTSWVPDINVLDRQVMADFIRAHGPNRVLFGSDYPYSDSKKSLNWIQSLPLSDEEKFLILSDNSRQLFLE